MFLERTPTGCARSRNSSLFAARKFQQAMSAAKATRKRLDTLLVERGLAESRQKAQAMILAGEIEIDGKKAEKAGLQVEPSASLAVHSRMQIYVSRGGFKLEGALEDFQMSVGGRVCLDVGSSTGGFTDCLLQHGAERVYAVDVNTDQLAWKLREDARVIALKKNARELDANDLDVAVDLVAIDVSFISVKKVLPGACACVKPGGDLVILVKPQFELEREDVGKGGIVRDKKLHERAIASVSQAAIELGLSIQGEAASRLAGAEGNQEYFLHARKLPKVESD
jgi:23S rRNA (cytidine1920-2'-O)/16S rRNA (cytidine1409-2'-O)-methyltransferase